MDAILKIILSFLKMDEELNTLSSGAHQHQHEYCYWHTQPMLKCKKNVYNFKQFQFNGAVALVHVFSKL